MTDTILLREYQDESVYLNRDDALYIESTLHKRIDIHRPVTGSQYVLNPGQFVGVVQLPSGRRLESRPKVPVSNLLYMLAIASQLPPPLLDERAKFRRFDDIFEFIVEHFLDLVEEKISEGLYRTYVDREENLRAIRGKVLIAENFRRNAISRHLTYCRYGDLTWDIPENQIIRQTVHALSLWGFSEQLRLRLWQVDSQLQEVTATSLPLSTFGLFRYNRLNADYEAIHNLCWLFLSGAALSDFAGDVAFPAFLIDMSRLFEAFVTQILQTHLAPELRVSGQSRRRLDTAGKIRMRLDLEFKQRGQVVAVGDCKYKLQSTEDAKVSDVYQVLAYATATNAPHGFLVYPSHESSVEDELDILHTEVTIRRVTINLGVAPDLLQEESKRFAAAIGRALAFPRIAPTPRSMAG